MNLTGDLALQLYSSVVVDKAEVFQHGNTLLIVRQKLKILVRHELADRVDPILDDPLVVSHSEVLREVLAVYALTLLRCVSHFGSLVEQSTDVHLFQPLVVVQLVPARRCPGSASGNKISLRLCHLIGVPAHYLVDIDLQMRACQRFNVIQRHHDQPQIHLVLVLWQRYKAASEAR